MDSDNNVITYKDRVYFKVIDEQILLGMCAVCGTREKDGHMFVHPQDNNQGLGVALCYDCAAKRKAPFGPNMTFADARAFLDENGYEELVGLFVAGG